MTAYQSYIDREWPRHKDEPAYMTAREFVVWMLEGLDGTMDWFEIAVGALEARDAEISRKAKAWPDRNDDFEVYHEPV